MAEEEFSDENLRKIKGLRVFFASKHPELLGEYYDHVIERMQAYRDYLLEVKQRIDRVKYRFLKKRVEGA